jgi:uncharacterized protein GlcG (DUF336 family)
VRSILVALLLAAPAAAQAPAPYGAPVTLAQAQRVAAAAEAEARRLGFAVAIAVVEPSGQLIHFQRLDGANYAAGEAAVDKARSAAGFRMSTRFWAVEASKPGGAWVLGLKGAMPLEGGIPLVAGGRTIGGVGVSGVASDDDAKVAEAGAAALR